MKVPFPLPNSIVGAIGAATIFTSQLFTPAPMHAAVPAFTVRVKSFFVLFIFMVVEININNVNSNQFFFFFVSIYITF